MNKMISEASLRELIQKTVKGIDLSNITDELNFTDIGLDSLDVASVLMAIDEEFDINIPDVDVDQCFSVSSTLSYLRNQDKTVL